MQLLLWKGFAGWELEAVQELVGEKGGVNVLRILCNMRVHNPRLACSYGNVLRRGRCLNGPPCIWVGRPDGGERVICRYLWVSHGELQLVTPS